MVDDHGDNLHTYCKYMKSMHLLGKEKLAFKKAVTQLSLDIKASDDLVFLTTILHVV